MLPTPQRLHKYYRRAMIFWQCLSIQISKQSQFSMNFDLSDAALAELS